MGLSAVCKTKHLTSSNLTYKIFACISAFLTLKIYLKNRALEDNRKVMLVDTPIYVLTQHRDCDEIS